jgi:2-isopropylmalate synthase
MNQQTWDAQQYQDNAPFVPELGLPVLALLNPQAHESILDLGCGDGTLTEKIAQVAREVIGIDSSPQMVAAAQTRGLNGVVMDGAKILYRNQFDAVFSNAALHWMLEYEAVIQGVYAALKPQGRFVGELGGYGNIATLVKGMEAIVNRTEDLGKFTNPWFFPQADEYKSHLENNGFRVNYIELIPRPTPLKTGVKAWLKVFANHVISGMAPEMVADFLEQTEQWVKPTLYSETQEWLADYVRLRFQAIKI